MRKWVWLCFMLLFPLNCAANTAADRMVRAGTKYVDLLPVISWTPSSHGYGSQTTGTNTDYAFTLSNTGNDTLELGSLAVSGSGFSLLSTTCGTNPFNLAASASCTATARFSPSIGGAFSGSLTLSAPNISDVVASLTGTGVHPNDTFYLLTPGGDHLTTPTGDRLLVPSPNYLSTPAGDHLTTPTGDHLTTP